MLDFIIKYWLQEVFGLLIIIGGIIGRHLWKTYQTGKKTEIEEHEKERDIRILDQIKEMCEKVTSRIDKMEKRNDKQDDSLDVLKRGVLSLQKEAFLKQGRDLLQNGHIITYEEYMAYSQQHAIYNGLGGNHEGDEQFKLVTQKFQTGLKNFEESQLK